MSIKGFQSQSKNGSQEFCTVQNVGNGKYALDVIQRVSYEKNTFVMLTSIDAVSPKRVMNKTSHGLISGDFIRWTSGLNAGVEIPVKSIDSANVFTLDFDLPNIPLLTDEFSVFGATSLKSDVNGNLVVTQGPLAFMLDGSLQQVIEDALTPANNAPLPSKAFYQKDGVMVPVIRDTVTPANNNPLPVEIVGANGVTISITAGDINVQLGHTGVSFDSVRVGDGTNILGINASNEALVKDTTAGAALSSILTELNDKVNTSDIVGLATHAKQDEAKTVLDNLLTELNDKLNTSDISGLATIAKQDVIIAALGSLLTELDVKLEPANLIGLATEAKQDSSKTVLDNILTELGQKLEVADLSTLATHALQTTINSNITGLRGQLPTTLGQKSSINSVSIVLSTDHPYLITTEFGLQPSMSDVTNINASATNIPSYQDTKLLVSASLGFSCKKIHLIDTTGSFIGVYSNGNLVYIFGPGTDIIAEIKIPMGNEVRIAAMDITTGNVKSSGRVIMNFMYN